MIAFEFDRAKMRRRLIIYASVVFGGLTIVMLLAGCVICYTARASWSLSLGIIMAALIVVELHLAGYAQWVGRLRIGPKKRSSAVVVNDIGVIDNASDYALGQLAWTEIERIYSQTLTHRMFGSRWRKMPMLGKFRGITIILKDEVDVQARLQQKSWSVRYAFKEQFKQGHKLWFFVPEMLLDTSADEMMQSLNDFYKTQVTA